MGQFSHVRNIERRYERFSEEASEEPAGKASVNILKGPKEKTGVEKPHKAHVDWDDLGEHEILHLKHGVLQRLAEEAREKAGSNLRVQKEAGVSRKALHEIEEGSNIISVKNFKALCDYLGIQHKEMDRHIIGIGSSRNPDALENPHLPFKLDTPEGATIIAATLHDGYLRSDGTTLSYANKDEENIETIKEAVGKVFGNIKPWEEEYECGVKRVDFMSCAIVDTLEEAGLPIGSKTKQRFHVPDFISGGSEELQKAYLRQTLMDEGYWREHGGKVEEIHYTQSTYLDEDKLTAEDMKVLRSLEFEEYKMPTEVLIHRLRLTREVREEIEEEYPNLWRVIEESKPPNLEEEKEMLEKLFDAHPDVRPRCLYYTEKGGYKVEWELIIDEAEDARRVAEELNLPIPKHKERKGD
ncbi:MAG: helix-turn-helix domain-containing protein [Nitrososphaerota archaeon]